MIGKVLCVIMMTVANVQLNLPVLQTTDTLGHFKVVCSLIVQHSQIEKLAAWLKLLFGKRKDAGSNQIKNNIKILIDVILCLISSINITYLNHVDNHSHHFN